MGGRSRPRGTVIMNARSIASLTLSFGLVSIPVKLYSATQSAGSVSFHLLHRTCGSRLRQQYVCIREDVVVPREEMARGYEAAKDQYVLFTEEELKSLEEAATQAVEVVEFIPADAIDPVYYDRAYYLAPDKGGARPYALFAEALRRSGRTALARWTARGRQHIVQVRPVDEGLVMQQLLYAAEVRRIGELEVPPTDVRDSELKLALQLIEQAKADAFRPDAWHDEVKARIEAAVQRKVEGREVTVSEAPESGGAQVIDLMAALKASLDRRAASRAEPRKDSGGARPAVRSPRVPRDRGRRRAPGSRTG